MILQDDEPELLEWAANAAAWAGDFLKNFAAAAMRADHENYPLLRPVLLTLRKKYPKYDADGPFGTALAKRSIAGRGGYRW